MSTRTALTITIAVIVVSVTAAVVALGSPAKARERRFDTKRAQHLDELTMLVNSHYSAEGRLPQSVGDLERTSEYAAAVRDPDSGQPYEYRSIDGKTYELCATFQQPSQGGSREWRHGTGRHCFKRYAKDGRP